MASEVKRLITRALDSLAVDGLLHAAGQDEPLPVRVVLQPVADRNKSYLEGTETPLGGYGQNYGIGYLPAGEESLAMQGTPPGGVVPAGRGTLPVVCPHKGGR